MCKELSHGTIINQTNCIESEPTDILTINFDRQTDEYGLRLYWDGPTNPNGFIMYFKLFRDDNLVFISDYQNDGYYSNDNLTFEYLDTIENLDVNYTYILSMVIPKEVLIVQIVL